MIEHIEAIYEQGVFRPLTPLALAEQERVHLIVKSSEEDWVDSDALRIAEQEAEPDLSLEEIRAELARIPGTWSDDVIAERGEYQMAAYFFDTSALVKRYHPESGTPIVDQVFSEADTDIIISRLVLVEIVSAFALKVRSDTISAAQFERYRKQVHRDVRLRKLRVARMAAKHFQLADELLCRHATKHRLRTLDALQLASAIELQASGLSITFACADDVLCHVAKLEGLAVLHPLGSSSTR